MKEVHGNTSDAVGKISRRTLLLRAGMGGVALTVGGGMTSLLSGCSSSTETSSGLKHLTISFADAPPTLDIVSGFVGNIATVMLMIHEPLVTYDNDLKLIPHLASKWSQPRPRRYLFTLRDGVKFWDGSPLTTEDVVYSIQRNTDPKFGSQLAGYFSNVKSVKSVGADGVMVDLHVADETFPYILSLASIVKRSLAEPKGRHYAEPGTKIIGTGPYVVKNFKANQPIEFTRNEDYWGTKPVAETASIKIIPDETDRQLAMRSGATVMSYDVSLSQTRQWSSVPNVAVPVAPGLEVTYLSFDLSQAPWNDIHVRRAVSLAWNGQFVKSVLGSAADSATAIVPPAMWSGLLDRGATDSLYAKLPTIGFDLAQAKTELEQSSVPKGFSATLSVPTSKPNMQKAALSLKDNLAKIGIKLTVKNQVDQAWSSYQSAHKNLGLQLHSTGPDYPDPANYFGLLFLGKNASANNSNLANYKDSRFDALFAKQAGELDKAKRSSYLSEMLTMVTQEVAYLPLWWSGFAVAYRSDQMKYDHLTSLCYLQAWTGNIKSV